MTTLKRLALIAIFLFCLFGILVLTYFQKALPAVESLRILLVTKG